jgi:hypothetical protein
LPVSAPSEFTNGISLHFFQSFFRAQLRQRVLDLHAAAQPHHVLRAVAAFDAVPAGVFGPVLFSALLFLLGDSSVLRRQGVELTGEYGQE